MTSGISETSGNLPNIPQVLMTQNGERLEWDISKVFSVCSWNNHLPGMESKPKWTSSDTEITTPRIMSTSLFLFLKIYSFINLFTYIYLFIYLFIFIYLFTYLFSFIYFLCVCGEDSCTHMNTTTTGFYNNTFHHFCPAHTRLSGLVRSTWGQVPWNRQFMT